MILISKLIFIKCFFFNKPSHSIFFIKHFFNNTQSQHWKCLQIFNQFSSLLPTFFVRFANTDNEFCHKCLMIQTLCETLQCLACLVMLQQTVGYWHPQVCVRALQVRRHQQKLHGIATEDKVKKKKCTHKKAHIKTYQPPPPPPPTHTHTHTKYTNKKPPQKTCPIFKICVNGKQNGS